jgi:hypothetical protein
LGWGALAHRQAGETLAAAQNWVAYEVYNGGLVWGLRSPAPPYWSTGDRGSRTGNLSSASRCASNLFAHTAEQVLSLGRRRCPNGLEVCQRPTAKLDIGVEATPVRRVMEMEEWLVPQMKVRAVALVTGDIHKPVNGPQRLDEFCVCHPSLVIALSRDPLGEGWAWNRSAMPVRGLVRPRHRNYLDGEQRSRSSDYCRASVWISLGRRPELFANEVKSLRCSSPRQPVRVAPCRRLNSEDCQN